MKVEENSFLVFEMAEIIRILDEWRRIGVVLKIWAYLRFSW